MIATTRGLAVLAVIATVLGVVLVVGGSRDRARVDRSVASSFEPARVTGLAFAWPGHSAIELSPGPGGTWHWGIDHAVADPTTVDALFAALRGATWHRREAATAAGATVGELRIRGGSGASLEIRRGSDIAAAGQSWLVVGRHALLVDRWVATALFPEPLALRLREPGAGALAARTIVSGPLRIEGQRQIAPSSLWLDPTHLRALREALAALEIVALPATPIGTPSGGTPSPASDPIAFDGPRANELAAAGTCAGDRVLLHAKTGAGCVERAAWERVGAAFTKLRAPVEHIIDRRPLPVTPASLTLAGGAPLELAGQPRVGDEDANPERVAQLLAALAAPAEVVARPSGGAATPRATIVGKDEGGTEVTLELFATTLGRQGEPVALRPTPEAWAVINRPASSLRDPVLWKEDATTITAIAIGGVTYTRGAVLGEWTRTPVAPGGAADTALVDALASALAIVRAPSISTPNGPTPLALSVTFAPPMGTPTTHELAIGAPGSGGCPARFSGLIVLLGLELCTAAHALAAAR